MGQVAVRNGWPQLLKWCCLRLNLKNATQNHFPSSESTPKARVGADVVLSFRSLLLICYLLILVGCIPPHLN